MSNLTFFTHEYQGHDIRATADGRFSIFDVLVAMGIADKASNAKNVYDRLSKGNPEVTTYCSNFKFAGRGQRETPVATEEGIVQLLMLAPGGQAAQFRQWAAGIIVDPDKALDHAVNKYVKQGKDAKWIRQRLDGKIARHKLTDCLKRHGVSGAGYAICTDALNTGLFGKTAKELKDERGVLATRDGLDDVELAGLSLAERLAERDIERGNLQGNERCADACYDSGNRVNKVIND